MSSRKARMADMDPANTVPKAGTWVRGSTLARRGGRRPSLGRGGLGKGGEGGVGWQGLWGW